MTELDAGNSGEYKVEAIWDSVVYVRESTTGHLPGLYYLVSWKDYTEEENTWEPYLAIQHLRKLISLFYKEHLNKPITTSKAIHFAPPMARPTVRPTVTKTKKRKRGRPIKDASKRARRNWVWFLWRFWTFLSYLNKKVVNDHFDPRSLSLLVIPRVVNEHFDSCNLSHLFCTKCWSYSRWYTFHKWASVFLFKLSYQVKRFFFSLTAPHKSNRSVFLPSHPIRLGVFLSSDQAGFLPQFHWVRRFFAMLQTKHHRTFKQSSCLRGKAIVMPAITWPG